MKSIEKQAYDSLSELVRHVFAQRVDGLIKGVTYEELAKRIGRLNKHGIGHAHGMGLVLGNMGHILQGLEGEWGEPIPYIQSLVVKKSGEGKNLPDKGIKEFWPDYPKLSLLEKKVLVKAEHQRVVAFGSRWNTVLEKLGLPKITITGNKNKIASRFGSGGESARHKKFKQYIRTHPLLVGADETWQSFEEYTLPSLDEIDVLFKSGDACIAVEVKSSLSDALPSDYERGIYQTVKYGALLKAMSRAGTYSIPSNIQSILVLESSLPAEYSNLVNSIGVKVIQKVAIKE